MVERLTARKCAIKDLVDGKYLVKEGTTPNHVTTSRGEVSRANVIAAVIDKPGGNAIIMDDGSAQIEARSFDKQDLFENIMVGDIVLLIGRPREYEDRRYLVAEIAKRLGTPKWLEYRKHELAAAPQTELLKKIEVKVEKAEPVAEPVVESHGDKLLALIKKLDTGTGAAIEEVVAQSGNPGAEGMLTTLMAEGEIFEIKPGWVKVLE